MEASPRRREEAMTTNDCTLLLRILDVFFTACLWAGSVSLAYFIGRYYRRKP
jgi:hypothetical protein